MQYPTGLFVTNSRVFDYFSRQNILDNLQDYLDDKAKDAPKLTLDRLTDQLCAKYAAAFADENEEALNRETLVGLGYGEWLG